MCLGILPSLPQAHLLSLPPSPLCFLPSPRGLETSIRETYISPLFHGIMLLWHLDIVYNYFVLPPLSRPLQSPRHRELVHRRTDMNGWDEGTEDVYLYFLTPISSCSLQACSIFGGSAHHLLGHICQEAIGCNGWVPFPPLPDVTGM